MGPIIQDILLSILLTTEIALIVYMLRLPLVKRERERVFIIVLQLINQEHFVGKDEFSIIPKSCFKRIDEFEEIWFYDMLLAFWKPVDSFYKNHSCIKPANERADMCEKLEEGTVSE